MTEQRGILRRLLTWLGLISSPDGMPLTGKPNRRSRYARGVASPSPRLDEDIDDLRARLAAIEGKTG